ncbi:hypothetical protein OVA26_16095 [Microbacterium sp. SL62]|uniref:hypothetical protein n=1 Tax=Microbacterium sp. SL62 TaxID=2995139 RepID=UPI0022737230|nr:hypothetical protein [Microbacterium sp. SL62]MCY1718457.1 hypothetical protein [Microbacterium sp. SL62]
MNFKRTTPREVLRDKRGFTTSLPEVLAGMSLRMVTVAAVGGVLATGLAFWAITQASADTSSSFQNVNVRFEQAVNASDIVLGNDTNRIGLLKNVDGGKCEVQTWQNGTRDGKTTLQVDTEVRDEVCAPTTPLSAPATTAKAIELVFDIETPEFAYANLGGREITFDPAANPTLVTASKPEGTKQVDFDDLRPFKVTLALKALDEDTSANTQKSLATGYTNVLNISEVQETASLIPTPSTDVIPGPLRITGTVRSTTIGESIANTREGVAISFNGGVCTSGPTKIDASFVQQSPSEAPRVNTVLNSVLTGGIVTVDLGSVPNGATGIAEVAATCSEGAVVVKDTAIYTQPIPGPSLKVVADALAPHVHQLTWERVSSLPTTFDVFSARGTNVTGVDTVENRVASVAELTHRVDTAGATYGVGVTYGVVAVVGETRSPVSVASLNTPVRTPGATWVSYTGDVPVWTAVTCPSYTTAQYSFRSNMVYGTGTWAEVPWTAWSDWSTDRTTTMTTREYSRTTYEVQSRCTADATGVSGGSSTSSPQMYFVPESTRTVISRSTTAGLMFSGAREGARVVVTGGRCYDTTSTVLAVNWNPTAPAGQKAPRKLSFVQKISPAGIGMDMSEVANGSDGVFGVTVNCSAMYSARTVVENPYSQPLPNPVLTVTQGATGDEHKLSWTAVSSLPTTFSGFKSADWGYENSRPDSTTELTQTLTYIPGTTYGNKTVYGVSAMVGGKSVVSPAVAYTTPWPAVPAAQNISWTGAGGSNKAGRLDWTFPWGCPAGTKLQAQTLENRSGQSNGGFATDVRAVEPWKDNNRSYSWNAGYALYGYGYQVGVNAKCLSVVTGYESGVASTQSGTFVMPILQPAPPVWDAYNYREWVRGTNWTYSTCYNGGCPSITIDYKTYCSEGSWVNWSNFTSTDWNPRSYNHPFGWQDNWLLQGGTRNVTYHNAKYSCGTPWVGSPQSDPGNSVVIQVRS